MLEELTYEVEVVHSVGQVRQVEVLRLQDSVLADCDDDRYTRGGGADGLPPADGGGGGGAVGGLPGAPEGAAANNKLRYFRNC